MARRLAAPLDLDDMDTMARRVPLLANLFPSDWPVQGSDHFGVEHLDAFQVLARRAALDRLFVQLQQPTHGRAGHLLT